MAAVNDVKKIYKEIVQDVCTAVREALSEEGFDDHTLQELKTMWLTKLDAAKALEPLPSSAVDDATTRTNRRGTTNNDANHQASNVNKQINVQRPTTNQMNFSNPTTNSNPSFMLSANSTLSTPANLSVPQIHNPYPRTTQPIRQQYNPPSMGNGPMKTTHQIDGSNDEHQSTEIRSKRKNKKKGQIQISFQIDGTGPPDSDEENEDDDNEAEPNEDDDELENDDDEDGNEEGKEDPNPLCSDDDVSEDEPAELFETDNVIVCQYDKISRTKNKWRFHLKSGVMNINGRDFIFNKATGEADW